MSLMWSDLPFLGAGLGYRAALRSELLGGAAGVDWLELTAEQFREGSREEARELDLLRQRYPLVPHGLSVSLGSPEGPDGPALTHLARLAERTGAPWASEHIAYTRAGGHEIGHLAPLPFNRDSCALLGRGIRRLKAELCVPLLLENISYVVPPPASEFDEAEFLRRVLEENDCGWLLDVTNVYANAVNHGYDPRAFLERMPLERAVQLHVVGGHHHGGLFIDSHSSPVPPEVWELVAFVTERAPVRGILLERDVDIPPLAELLPELERARGLMREQAVLRC
jgi:uncharacterized protein